MKTISYTNLDFFETIDNEEKAYWLGFLMQMALLVQ